MLFRLCVTANRSLTAISDPTLLCDLLPVHGSSTYGRFLVARSLGRMLIVFHIGLRLVHLRVGAYISL